MVCEAYGLLVIPHLDVKRLGELQLPVSVFQRDWIEAKEWFLALLKLKSKGNSCILHWSESLPH